jgi:hypothetical protein
LKPSVKVSNQPETEKGNEGLKILTKGFYLKHIKAQFKEMVVDLNHV